MERDGIINDHKNLLAAGNKEMTASSSEKVSNKKQRLSYNFTLIGTLVFVLPLLTLTYILYTSSISLRTSQAVIFVLMLILVLTGFMMLRQIFDKFLMLTTLMKKTEVDDAAWEYVEKGTSELYEISVSFHNLISKFEKTTHELEQRVYELFSIKELIEVAGKKLDFHGLLNVLLDKAVAVTKATIGSVFMVEKESRRFRVVGSRGWESKRNKVSYIDFDASTASSVVFDKKPLLIQDIENDPRTQKPNIPTCGPAPFISMPIFVEQEVVAVLNLAHKETEELFNHNDEHVLSIMIAEIGFALENALLHSKLQENLNRLQAQTTELARANRRLQKEIDERNRAEEDKRRVEEQLKRAQKMEAIGTLAGGVAHDLNNILAGLISYPDLLLRKISEDSDLREPLATIRRSGEKAAAIVQDLLTLARRGVQSKEVVNINHVLSDFFRSPEYEKMKSFHPHVLVEIHPEENLLNILGSPVHLFKTVMNLFSNAAEAIPSEGKIVVSTENRYVDQIIRGYDHVEEGDYATLIVSDTGAGISSQDRERIFEPFYTKKVMGRSGTGLGMAVVWGTIKDHDGYIDIESSLGKGTTVTLYFPVTRKGKTEDISPVPLEDYMGKGEKILVVDDVEEQRIVASKIIQNLGYEVDIVSSGEEAVDYMKVHTADLLVLDMIMDPGIDGLETYKRILELRPNQKAIIASGFSETKRVRKAQSLGAGAYIKKPYLLETIGPVMRRELDK